MSRSRRFAILAAVALSGAVVAPGSPAQAADKGPILVAPALAPMLPGQQGWISALWTTGTDACDIKITASAGGGVTFNYPTNTSSHTSLYINSALAKHNIDFSAFTVTVPATVTSAIPVTLTVSYVDMKENSFQKDDDLRTKKFTCTGTRATRTTTATIPITTPTANLVQQTTAVTVVRKTPVWANISFRGLRPNLANFRVTLTPPAGLTVSYPGDTTFAGLNGGVALPVGDDDYAAVRLDAANLPAGTYQVPLKATWTGGSHTGQLTLTVN